MKTMMVDFCRRMGTFKPMNGVDLGPAFHNLTRWDLSREYYQKLNIQSIRLHDVPLCNPGMNVVDVHQIFPFFDADPANPASYNFKQTDDYLQMCVDMGLEIEYRLGESIEHSPCHYYNHPPKDFEKWAEICCRIAEHYTKGWADGFHWNNIRYWTVWCEPNEKLLWSGTAEEYFRLYETVAKKFSERLPELKLGGPCWGGCNLEKIEDFLAYCQSRKLKLDFIEWNQYMYIMNLQLSQPAAVKELAEKYGYGDVELHLGEWHYFNRHWGENRNPDTASDVNDPIYGMSGFSAAGYTGCCLARFQDLPLDREYFYTGGFGSFGIFDNYGNPKKIAYAIEAYGQVLACSDRFYAEVGETLNPFVRERFAHEWGEAAILAGRSGNSAVIMISAFMWIDSQFSVEIKGLEHYDVSVFVTDKDHNREYATFMRRGNFLEIQKPSSSAVYLICLQIGA